MNSIRLYPSHPILTFASHNSQNTSHTSTPEFSGHHLKMSEHHHVTHDDFAHNAGELAKSTTEWLLPDALGLDWLGEYAGTLFEHIMNPVSLGIAAVSIVGSTAALYAFSMLHPTTKKPLKPE